MITVEVNHIEEGIEIGLVVNLNKIGLYVTTEENEIQEVSERASKGLCATR